MRKYIFRYKWLGLLYLIFSLILSGMTVYISIILRDIVDVALNLDSDGFWSLILLSTIFFLCFGAGHYLLETVYAWLIAKVIRDLRADVFSGILNLDVSEFEEINSADYISALTNDIKMLEERYFEMIAGLVFMAMQMVIAIVVMFVFSWIVAAALLGTLVILVVAQSLFGLPISVRQVRLSESLSAFTAKVKDVFSGFEVVKSYRIKGHMEENFKADNNRVMKAGFSLNHVSAVSTAVSTVIGLFLQVGVIFFSAYLIIRGHLTAGVMIALLNLAGQVTTPIQNIGQMMPMIVGSKEIAERLLAFASSESAGKGTQTAGFETAITVKGLSFAYPEMEEKALDGVDFCFEKNKKYALIGPSGCGKTTLVKALIGHLGGYEGEILYDGAELGELTADSVGAISSMVHQNVYMFDDTIRQNICLFDDLVERCLALAVSDSGVDLFLDTEKTLDFAVGENGSNLSGGQRQRIAVARGLIQNKPLLILDEGTSAIDRQTGADIENRLLKRGALTLITITHSLDENLLGKYDIIISMRDGKIADSGSFSALRERGAI